MTVDPSITHRQIKLRDIEMHIAEAGPADGPLVLLIHGFPELWYSWRHQLPALGAAGYHAVAPDLRGYGQTSVPEGEIHYGILELTGDLLSLQAALGAEKCVYVGHDWGAILVWDLALRRPERMHAVVGMSVPFLPRGPMPPVQMLTQLMGDNFFYIVYFQEPGVADAELAADPHRTMRTVLFSASGDHKPDETVFTTPRKKEGTGFLTGMESPASLPAWITEEDVDYFATQFARTGFSGAINYYRNMDRNWERNERFAGKKVEIPALFISGELDAVTRFAPSAGMDEHVPDLRGKHFIPGAGHWVQQENPAETNKLLIEFLDSLGPLSNSRQ